MVEHRVEHGCRVDEKGVWRSRDHRGPPRDLKTALVASRDNQSDKVDNDGFQDRYGLVRIFFTAYEPDNTDQVNV